MAGAGIFRRIGSTARVPSASRSSGRQCPRIAAEFLDQQRRKLGPLLFAQEYEGEFIDAQTSAFSSELIGVGYLERLPLGTPYPGIVAYVSRLLGRLSGCPIRQQPCPRHIKGCCGGARWRISSTSAVSVSLSYCSGSSLPCSRWSASGCWGRYCGLCSG